MRLHEDQRCTPVVCWLSRVVLAGFCALGLAALPTAQADLSQYTRYEYSLAGGQADAIYSEAAHPNYKAAQTFTVGRVGPNEDFKLKGVSLYLWKEGNPGSVGPYPDPDPGLHVAIYDTDPAGVPRDEIVAIVKPDVAGPQWYEILLPEDHVLLRDTTYAIVLWDGCGDSHNRYRWGIYDGNVYSGGEYFLYDSAYGPGIWKMMQPPITIKRDFQFGVYGVPALGNQSPVAEAGGPYGVDEGASVDLSATGNDPDGDPLTYAWDLDDNGTFEAAGQSVEFSAAHLDGPGSHEVVAKAIDAGGLPATDSATVEVRNVPPSIAAVTGPVEPVSVGTTIVVSAGFTDPGVLDTHTATWNWGDGSSSAGTVTEADGSGTAQGSHAYATPGVYAVAVTVTDDDGGSASRSFLYAVVYDASGGFVTGGGWINSPPGAYAADPSLTGKATFGFVARYQKGANVPTGQTEFWFHAGDLNFHSTAYQWLVVAGPHAKFKGPGTVNGVGAYGFMLTATDGQLSGGGGVDKSRIKITDGDAVVYDNKMGEPDDSNAGTEIGGGSIVIHDSK